MDFTIEYFIMPGLVILQILMFLLSLKKRQTAANVAAIENLNEAVDLMQAKIERLVAENTRLILELDTLRPLAVQVPILKAQICALETHLQNCLERENENGHVE